MFLLNLLFLLLFINILLLICFFLIFFSTFSLLRLPHILFFFLCRRRHCMPLFLLFLFFHFSGFRLALSNSSWVILLINLYCYIQLIIPENLFIYLFIHSIKIISESIDDYFMVGLTNTSSSIQAPVRGAYPLCGKYNKPAFGGPMTVYCGSNMTPFRYVIVQLPTSSIGGMIICELEIFGKYFKLFQ